MRAAATVRPLAGSRPAIEVSQLSHGQGHWPQGEPGHGLGAAPGLGQGRNSDLASNISHSTDE